MKIPALSLTLLFCGQLTAAVYPSSYDVVYDRISISVNPGSSAALTGTVTTWFKTTTSNLGTIGFDLEHHLTVSSISYHGVPLPATSWSQASDVLLITFPAPIATTGTLDSVTIAYGGTPLVPTTSIPSGYNYAAHSSGNYIIYTLGEAYMSHTWWPCKDSLVDKIDSVDLIVTTPSTYKVGGNGTVTEVVTGSTKVSTWKTRYPIATYLINFAVANYQDYAYTINTGLTTPINLPIHNYLFPEDYTAGKQTILNSIQTILPAYVSLLNTDYPFLNEKYGTAECTNFGGALEVQSMTFVASGAYSTSILAHELSHQWFGDRVTTNDWHHIWLNEGFAEFFQYVIYPEQLQSAAAALSSRQGLKNAVTNTSTTYVSNISSVDQIFIPSSSVAQPYEKGAMTLSMLRAWLGDANFYTALYNYLNAPGLAYNFTSVDSLQKYMQAAAPNPNLDLTNFFSDWVYKPGRVKYVVNYQFDTKGIYFNLSQTPTSTGAGYFDMPVPIEIKGAGLDTTVVIIDRGGILYNSVTGASAGNIIHYNLSATPTSLSFDPNSLVLATATMTPVTTLPLMDIKLSAERHGNAVAVSWKVTTNETIKSFTVERSTNGSDFNAVDEESVIASTNGQYIEGWNDQQAVHTACWYRLRVDLPDGSFAWSPMQPVGAAVTNSGLEIIPNPTYGTCQVRLPLQFISSPGNNGQPGVAQTGILSIYNAAGQLIQQIVVAGGNNLVELNCSNYAAGIYQIVYSGTGSAGTTATPGTNSQKLTGTLIKK